MVRAVGTPGIILDRIYSETKLRGGEPARGDGYFVRTTDGKRIGPMSEREFNIVRATDDVLRVASAWRESGGAIFKVELKQRVLWDVRHALSCKAFNHCFELVIIVFCFFCTLLSFALLNTKQMKKERDEAGPGLVAFMGFLFVFTIGAVVATIRKLMQRWHRASSEVYYSEV